MRVRKPGARQARAQASAQARAAQDLMLTRRERRLIEKGLDPFTTVRPRAHPALRSRPKRASRVHRLVQCPRCPSRLSPFALKKHVKMVHI